MTDKVIVITGASSGIGAALALQLAQRGEKLVLSARRKAELEQVAERCGGETLPVIADVVQRDDVEQLRDQAIYLFGHVDVWVNNAGRGIGRSVMDLTDQDFDEMMVVNTKSALYGMQTIIPHFKERQSGHLINVSSTLGRVPFASYRSAYSAAKAALNSLTANLRMDLRRDFPEIHISLVMPPMVSSEFAKNALHGTPIPPGGFRSGMTPQTPEECAAAIVELIDHPKAEIFTNPSMAELMMRYYADIEAFEANLGR